MPRTKFESLLRTGAPTTLSVSYIPNSDTDLTFFACSFDYWSGRNFGDCREYKTLSLIGQAMFVPRFFALAPETPLKSFGN
jgi:hypothetical protein